MVSNALMSITLQIFFSGPLPDKYCYDPDSMSTKEREKFLQWYE